MLGISPTVAQYTNKSLFSIHLAFQVPSANSPDLHSCPDQGANLHWWTRLSALPNQRFPEIDILARNDRTSARILRRAVSAGDNRGRYPNRWIANVRWHGRLSVSAAARSKTPSVGVSFPIPTKEIDRWIWDDNAWDSDAIWVGAMTLARVLLMSWNSWMHFSSSSLSMAPHWVFLLMGKFSPMYLCLPSTILLS